MKRNCWLNKTLHFLFLNDVLHLKDINSNLKTIGFII